MFKLHWPQHYFPNTPRLYVAAFFIFIAFVLASSLTIAILSYRITSDYYAPEIIYTHQFETAYEGTLCPGDTLYFFLHWKMKHTDAVARLYESWYDLDNSDVVYSSGPSYDIISDNASHSTLITKVVPPLSPGHYEYRRAVDSPHAGATVVRVSFVISPACPPETLPTPRPTKPNPY